MALTNGPNLGLLVNGNAGEGHYTDLMKQWRGLDGLTMPNAKGYLTNTPPGSPTDGDLYIVGAAPTGAWAAQGGKVTRWSSVENAWEFYAPKNGWVVQSNSAREVYRYTGGAWEIFYQEGTWTPTASGLGGTGISYATKFVKIGDRADFSIVITGSSLTSTAPTTSVSLPFTAGRFSIGGADNNSVVGGIAEIAGSSFYLPTISAPSRINASGTMFLS